LLGSGLVTLEKVKVLQYGNVQISTWKTHRPPWDLTRMQSGPESSAAAVELDERKTLIRTAFRLEYATIAWMIVELAVALWAGIAARNLALLAFGIDSGIELASAIVLLWRLSVELKQGRHFLNVQNGLRVASQGRFFSPLPGAL